MWMWFNSNSNIFFKHFFENLFYFYCFVFNESNFFARILSIFFFSNWLFINFFEIHYVTNMSRICYIHDQINEILKQLKICVSFVIFIFDMTKFMKQNLRQICHEIVVAFSIKSNFSSKICHKFVTNLMFHFEYNEFVEANFVTNLSRNYYFRDYDEIFKTQFVTNLSQICYFHIQYNEFFETKFASNLLFL